MRGLLSNMRKRHIVLYTAIILIVAITLLLNMGVTTKQCLYDHDYFQCRNIKIPLYLKLLNFFDRHYNLKYLAKRILTDIDDEEERVIKLFEWTYENIKKRPEILAVVDDHIWYTIIRGYGVNDQFSDIFSTLCNYSGIEAFFGTIHSKEGDKQIQLSFAKVGNKWILFDPYNGVYFKDSNNQLCGIESFVSKECKSVSLGKGRGDSIDYSLYLDNIANLEKKGFSRAGIQSPLKRLLFELKKLRGTTR